jgi:putative ABC transport system permease protein
VVISSIMTAFSGIFIISAVEQNILVNINQNISISAPDLYLVDIATSQIGAVEEIVGSSFESYPIVRGRLLSIANRDLTTSDDPGITREFNMTYRTNLLPDEKIIEGTWHDFDIKNAVSIDQSFAKEIGGANIGDTVTVFIQGLTVEAIVTSIRSSDQSSGTPFFYLVFSPDVIDSFPATYFATATVSPEAIVAIQSSLGTLYPNIIPVETKQILSTVTTLLQGVVLAVKVIGIPSIILGFILVVVMTGQSMYERRTDVLIFRAFGLRARSIFTIFLIEISALIILATMLAYLVAHGVAYSLNKFLFSFTLFVFDTTPLTIVFGILLLVSLFAYIVARELTTTPLKNLLSEK